MEYHFKIHKEDDGFWAECVELKGCRTQANSREELDSAMTEALNLFLSESDDSLVQFQSPKKAVGKNIASVEVDPGVAMALTIRQTRLKKKLTQNQMKDLLGIKTLSNYQRLEDPKKANPELKTLVALTKVLPDLHIAAIIDSYRVQVSGKKRVS